MIVDYITHHQAEFWLMLGFALLVAEVITGFTVGVFLFAGLASLLTGALMNFAVLPETWIAGIACTGVSSGVITAVLWRPMKALQGNKAAAKDNSSDLVGHEFILANEITLAQPGQVQYSGVSWRVEIDKQANTESLPAAQRVVVTSVEVGKFTVVPVV